MIFFSKLFELKVINNLRLPNKCSINLVSVYRHVYSICVNGFDALNIMDNILDVPDTIVVAVVAKEAWKTNLANVQPISSSSVESVKKYPIPNARELKKNREN